MPLYLISGVFLPSSKNPGWLNDLAAALPLEHITNGLHRAFGPEHATFGLTATDLLVLAAWTIVGLAVAMRRFAWLPSSSTTASGAGRTLGERLIRAARPDGQT